MLSLRKFLRPRRSLVFDSLVFAIACLYSIVFLVEQPVREFAFSRLWLFVAMVFYAPVRLGFVLPSFRGDRLRREEAAVTLMGENEYLWREAAVPLLWALAPALGTSIIEWFAIAVGALSNKNDAVWLGAIALYSEAICAALLAAFYLWAVRSVLKPKIRWGVILTLLALWPLVCAGVFVLAVYTILSEFGTLPVFLIVIWTTIHLAYAGWRECTRLLFQFEAE